MSMVTWYWIGFILLTIVAGAQLYAHYGAKRVIHKKKQAARPDRRQAVQVKQAAFIYPNVNKSEA
ncbi:hypothetical protein [Paenibacillus hubeiensis]|uniref:hypothetical protein n=1 Tax=Paenibacillus hubeiensis TaxID=3077330 RepID=UPI0031BA8660